MNTTLRCPLNLNGMRGKDSAVDVPADTDKVLTLPNVISLCRLGGIPVFLWLLADGHQVAAAIVLAVVAGTDWVDGGLARRLHQVTALGKILDPTIDRLLLLAAFVGALVVGAVPVWFGTILLARELLIAMGGLVCWSFGVGRLTVTWMGKIYAFGVMVSLPLFFLGDTDITGAAVVGALAWLIAVPSAVLGWITGIGYLKTGIQTIRAERGHKP